MRRLRLGSRLNPLRIHTLCDWGDTSTAAIPVIARLLKGRDIRKTKFPLELDGKIVWIKLSPRGTRKLSPMDFRMFTTGAKIITSREIDRPSVIISPWTEESLKNWKIHKHNKRVYGPLVSRIRARRFVHLTDSDIEFIDAEVDHNKEGHQCLEPTGLGDRVISEIRSELRLHERAKNRPKI